MSKKIAKWAGIVVIALLLGFGFLWSNLDSIVKSAIEEYGSDAAKVEVSLADVELSLSSGEGKLTGLHISNPEGFEEPDAFFLGRIDMKVDVSSVSGDGPIVINKIIIDDPKVFFEVNKAGKSNLQTIANNAQKYVGETSSDNAEKANNDADEEGRKIIVKLLIVSGGKVSISHAMLGDKKIKASIPTFSMHDVGADKGGLTPAELAGKLIAVISQKSSKAVSNEFVKGLGLPSVKVKTPDVNLSIGNVDTNIKGMFGK